MVGVYGGSPIGLTVLHDRPPSRVTEIVRLPVCDVPITHHVFGAAIATTGNDPATWVGFAQKPSPPVVGNSALWVGVTARRYHVSPPSWLW